MLVARDWGKDFSGLVIPVETLCKAIGPHLSEEAHNKKVKSIAPDHATGKPAVHGPAFEPRMQV